MSSEATNLKFCKNYAAQVTDDRLFHGAMVSGLNGIRLSTDPSPIQVTTFLVFQTSKSHYYYKDCKRMNGYLKFTPKYIYQQNRYTAPFLYADDMTL